MASTSITPQRPASTGTLQRDVRSLIMSDAFKAQIVKAMPEAMSPDVLLRVATTTIQKTPKLLDCSPESLMQCVLECAQLGLLPDGILGQAYLVPYKATATLQIGYRGILELARRSNQIKFVVAEAVYDCDDFSISYAPKRTISHDPAIDDEHRGEKEKGKYLPKGFRGVYALVLYKDDTIDFEYLPLHKVERIRAGSQAGSSADGSWINHFEEMARKTAIRALGKRLPLSADDLRHVVEDEYREAGLVENITPSAITDIIRNEEAEATMQQLGWPEGKRTQCYRSFSGNTSAMLAHLQGELAKTGRGLAPASTAEQPDQQGAEVSPDAAAEEGSAEEEGERPTREYVFDQQPQQQPVVRAARRGDW